MNEPATALRVEIWSDVVCPWCYIGKRRFERARARFEHPVEVTWRSFELNPNAPPVSETPYAERIARKYGTSEEQATRQLRRMSDLARAEGLDYRLEQTRSGRSFDAHRLLHLARERGVQDALKERLLSAYLEGSVAIGLRGELAPVAVAAGLDRAEVDAVLSGDAYADAVRADEQRALDIGITGVPFFLIDGRFTIPGAQDTEMMFLVLRRAWQRRGVEGAETAATADVCSDDTCDT